MIEVAVTFLNEAGYSNFFITGSISLIRNFGIDLKREPHDIDVILIGDVNDEEQLLFNRNGILINVFITKEYKFSKSTEIDGVKFVDDIQYIIRNKERMNRDKDIQDIEIINKFLEHKKNEQGRN